MKISIAMATYNGEKYLQEQLDSFVQQTRLPDELVVTDDCSTDETFAILKAFAKTAPFRVIVHQNEHNLGYAQNFNRALMGTTGDLVFLSDQDDVWFAEKIERMIQAAEDHPDALVLMHDAAPTHSDMRDSGFTCLGQLERMGENSERAYIKGCCAVIRRFWLQFCLPLPTKGLAHDTWIVGLAGGISRKRVISDVLMYHRRHVENVSNSFISQTTQVSRRRLFVVRLKNFGRRLITKKEKKLPTKGTMHQWLEEVIDRAPPAYKTDLSSLLARMDRQVEALACRARIREKTFKDRVGAVVRAHQSGVYKNFSGWKSAVKDLLMGTKGL